MSPSSPVVELRYLPHANATAASLRWKMTIFLTIPLALSLSVIIGFRFLIIMPAIWGDVILSPVVCVIGVWVLMFFGAAMAFFANYLWLMWRGPRNAPPVALRLDAHGLWFWTLLAQDCFLPWAAVSAVTYGVKGLKFAVVDRAAAIPGTVGMRGTHLPATLRRMQQRRDDGLAWSLVEQVDPARLDAALRQLSGGRIALGRH